MLARKAPNKIHTAFTPRHFDIWRGYEQRFCPLFPTFCICHIICNTKYLALIHLSVVVNFPYERLLRKKTKEKISSQENEQGYGIIIEDFGALIKDSLLPHHCQEVKLSGDSDGLCKKNINKRHLRER